MRSDRPALSDDAVLLVMLSPLLFLGLAPLFLGVVEDASTKLVEYGVLVDTDSSLVTVPGSEVGLDLVRVALLALAVIALICTVIMFKVRRRTRDLQQ